MIVIPTTFYRGFAKVSAAEWIQWICSALNLVLIVFTVYCFGGDIDRVSSFFKTMMIILNSVICLNLILSKSFSKTVAIISAITFLVALFVFVQSNPHFQLNYSDF